MLNLCQINAKSMLNKCDAIYIPNPSILNPSILNPSILNPSILQSVNPKSVNSASCATILIRYLSSPLSFSKYGYCLKAIPFPKIRTK